MTLQPSLESIQTTMFDIEFADGVKDSISAHEHFTCGSCAELADALYAVVPGSRVAELRIRIGDSISQLIHAGLEVGEFILDIEGLSDPAEWIARWSQQWDGAELSYRGRLPDVIAFENASSLSAARTVADDLSSFFLPRMSA
jgi:hypothetical protein